MNVIYIVQYETYTKEIKLSLYLYHLHCYLIYVPASLISKCMIYIIHLLYYSIQLKRKQ